MDPGEGVHNVNVVVMGHIMMDIAIKPVGPVRPASDTPSAIQLCVGGAGANTAIHLARLGGDTLLLGRIGADEIGRLVAGQLAREGVRKPGNACPGVKTGALAVLVDDSGERTMFPQRGANDKLDLPFVREHWPAGPVDALFISGYAFFQETSREAALWAMAQAKTEHIPIVIDPASYALIEGVGVERFLGWIAPATVVLPNRQEAAVLAGVPPVGSSAAVGGQVSAAARALGGRFPVVVVTLDAQGALLLTKDEEMLVAAEKVVVVDTTGAGDAFNAGFLHKLAGGGTPREAVKAGQRLAARVVQHIGPT